MGDSLVTACVRDSARWQCTRGMAVWVAGLRVVRGAGWVSDGVTRDVRVRVPCEAAWVPGWVRRHEGGEGERLRGWARRYEGVCAHPAGSVSDGARGTSGWGCGRREGNVRARVGVAACA